MKGVYGFGGLGMKGVFVFHALGLSLEKCPKVALVGLKEIFKTGPSVEECCGRACFNCGFKAGLFYKTFYTGFRVSVNGFVEVHSCSFEWDLKQDLGAGFMDQG